MRILQAMASIDHRRGGPSNAVRNLGRALTQRGHQVTIVAHDDGEPRLNEPDSDIDLQIIRFPLKTHAWQLSPEYVRWVKRHIVDFDAVLIHSLFLSHTFFTARAAVRAGVPYAIRPHGSLTGPDLANRQLIKAAYLKTVERPGLANAKFLYCTAEEEAKDAQLLGFGPTVVIPLGVEPEYFAHAPGGGDPSSFLYFGRIAEKKGLDIAIHALSLAAHRGSQCTLTIAGPDDEGLRSKYQRLASELGVSDQVVWHDFVGMEEKLDLIGQSGAFVLPSRGENFGIAVAEAMAAGLTPIITPHVSHARAVQEADAGIVVQRDAQAVAEAMLQFASSSNNHRLNWSRNAQDLAKRYSWPAAAEQFEGAINR